MLKYIKIAWRNLWRNPRRTIITAASVFFGVFFSVMMTSVQKGSFENMIGNMAKFSTGYIQIKHPDYIDQPSLNNSFIPTEELNNELSSNKLISNYCERIETFALASTGEKSFPAIIMGIQPEKEEKISGLSKNVFSGSYLNKNTNGLMIGKTLANNLNVNIGDSLVLFGQGYHGISAVDIFPIAAILDFPLPELNKNLIYLNLDDCAEYTSMNNRITSQILMLKNTRQVKGVKKSLVKFENDEIKIYDWKELMPEILNLIEGKEASAAMVKSLLFMIIAAGVLATIIMLMNERRREFAVMISIGFKKTRLMFMTFIESLLIGILGLMGGIVICLPIVYYLFHNPILVTGEMAETYKQMGFEPKISFDMSPDIFFSPAIIILVIFMVISIYQFWFIAKLNIAKSIKS